MKPWQIVVTVIAVVALGLGAFGTYQAIGLGSRAGDIEDDVSSVEGRADVLEDNVSAIDTDIISIETDIGTLQVDLSEVNAEVTSIEGNIATIETDIGTLQVDVLDINAEITSIEGDIATIETDVGTIEVNITTINGRITSIEGDIATIETNVGTLQADVASLESLVTIPPPESYGPIVLDIGTGFGIHPIDLPHPMYRVEFEFDVSGSDVIYEVWDPYWNVILFYGPAVSEGGGAFIAATSGEYYIIFLSTGTVTPSIITLSYTVYPAAPVVHGE